MLKRSRSQEFEVHPLLCTEIVEYLQNLHVSWLFLKLPVERAESPDKSESETASNPPPAEERRDSAKSDRPKSGRSKSGRSKSPKSPKERKSRTPSAKKRDKSKEKKEASDQTPADETGKKK